METLRQHMLQGGCSKAQTDRFVKRVESLLSQSSGFLREADLQPVEKLPHLQELSPRPELLSQTVVLKLNGGLGTSMGLTGPKGLLSVKEGADFYEICLRQLEAFQQRDGFRPPLLFMNSFSTEQATVERLRELGFSQSLPWGFLQSKVPKIDEEGRPAQAEETYAWCPPGHGDLYASLLDSGLGERLLEAGYRYLFVSNIDNLGAVLDSRPVAYMTEQKIPFLMEVTRRGEEDRKGGHLAHARSGGGLRLREVAQCHDDDLAAFQDIARHRYFNTNNLWIDLEAVEESWTDLPLIVNRKPVVPHDEQSEKVIQLETAMGAAIGIVEGAAAIEVGRDRFFPVKTTNDLFAIRSDLYRLNEASVLQATVERPTVVDLDPAHYKMMEPFERLVQGVPSLRACRRLKVTGPVIFSGEESLAGEVHLNNPSSTPKPAAEL